jgi:hypothetical protein
LNVNRSHDPLRFAYRAPLLALFPYLFVELL